MSAESDYGVSTSSQLVVIALDNLRVGGIQRIALDECYSLIDNKMDFQLLCFSKVEEFDSMLFVDSEYAKSAKVAPYVISGSVFAKIFQTTKFLRKIDKKVKVVVHSPSLAVVFFLARILSGKRFPILLWIHQVLSLSSFYQSLKRVIYSNAADCVFFTTKQFELEWNLVVANNIFLRFFQPRKRVFSRIGIYHKRVLSTDWKVANVCSSKVEHRIFASRITSWKGVSKFLELIQHREHSPIHYIFMTTDSYRASKFFENLNEQKVHVLTSRAPSHLRNVSSPVHLYPSDYGQKVNHPMSIGLNVLEFLVLGVPSLISKEDFLTFPELKACDLIKTSDWNNLEEVEQNLVILNSKKDSGQSWLSEENLTLISNKEHIDEILSYCCNFHL